MPFFTFVQTFWLMDMDFSEYLHQGYHRRKFDIQKKKIENFIDSLFHFVFFLDYHRCTGKDEIGQRLEGFKKEFTEILASVSTENQQVEALSDYFFGKFPQIYTDLENDAKALLKNDPAATDLEEIYYAYPGFYAIAIYRFAHELHLRKVPLIPRIWTEFAHGKTGIDIHPGATIGRHFFIDHGTGIVIGETTVIGNNVKLYQGVTLGALSVSKDIANTKRHPTVEDDVTIYSNATILGGETVIGKGSLIGGNVWITSSIAPDSTVYHKGQVIMKNRNPQDEPINYFI